MATLEEKYGVEKAAEIRQKLSAAAKERQRLHPTPKMSPEKRRVHSDLMKEYWGRLFLLDPEGAQRRIEKWSTAAQEGRRRRWESMTDDEKKERRGHQRVLGEMWARNRWDRFVRRWPDRAEVVAEFWREVDSGCRHLGKCDRCQTAGAPPIWNWSELRVGAFRCYRCR